MNRHSISYGLSLLLALAAVTPACHGDSNCVTCEDNRTPTPIPPAVTDLGGTWSGTIRETRSDPTRACDTGDLPITAQLEEEGSQVRISLSQGGRCSNFAAPTYTASLAAFDLSGRLTSSGTYKGDDCPYGGPVDGIAAEGRIHLTGRMNGCRGAVEVTIDLTR